MGGDSSSSDVAYGYNPAMADTPSTALAPNRYSDQIEWMADSLMQNTPWVRGSFFENYAQPLLKGQLNPQTNALFAPQYDLLRNSMEGQYNQAKANVLASTPRGGAMTNALASLENSRAQNTGLGASSLGSSILKDLWDKTYSMGFGTQPVAAMSGLSTPAQLLQSGRNTYTTTGAQTNMFNANSYNTAAQTAIKQMMQDQATDSQGKSGLGSLGTGIGSLVGLAAAPFTGGTSLIGTGLNAASGLASGLGSGKSGGGSSLYNINNGSFASGLAGLSY